MPSKDQEKRKGLYHNWLSYLGSLLMALSLMIIAFLLLVEFSLKKASPYIGIVPYMIMPAFFFLGLLFFLWGMRRESIRRRLSGDTEGRPFPRLHLNDARQRRLFGIFIVGGGLVAVIFAFVAYNGFLFTESVTFCGEVCHTVMRPEYTAYKASLHARVPCVGCHVGEGASRWRWTHSFVIIPTGNPPARASATRSPFFTATDTPSCCATRRTWWSERYKGS